MSLLTPTELKHGTSPVHFHSSTPPHTCRTPTQRRLLTEPSVKMGLAGEERCSGSGSGAKVEANVGGVYTRGVCTQGEPEARPALLRDAHRVGGEAFRGHLDARVETLVGGSRVICSLIASRFGCRCAATCKPQTTTWGSVDGARQRNSLCHANRGRRRTVGDNGFDNRQRDGLIDGGLIDGGVCGG